MKKSTAIRSLLLSGLSMLLCFSMLIGSTFAWFTDEVKSGTNTIIAGNLDVELYHSDKKESDVKVDSTTVLFDDVDSDKWEPGAMAWEKFTVVNEGNLALKYQFTLNALNATVINGTSFASMLKVAVVDDTFTYTRENVAAIDADKWSDLATFTLEGNLEKQGDEAIHGIIIWWQPSDNDNLFNMNNANSGKKVSVDVGVNLFATQLDAEEDSFGPDYDADVTYPVNISASTAVVTDANNKTTAEAIITYSATSAAISEVKVTVPAGAQLKDGATQLTLKIEEAEGVNPDVATQITSNQTATTYEISLEGLADTNDQDIEVSLVIEKGLVDVKLYHKGTPIACDYDPITGELTFTTKGFSPFTVVSATKVFEEGKGTAEDPYIINTPEDMLNISKYYHEYKYYKVADGVETLDLNGIGNLYLNGSFDGNGVEIVNLTTALFRTVGLSGVDATIKISNMDVTVHTTNGNALVRNIFNEGNTIFENVAMHGYIEGQYNMGSFYNYGTANSGTSDGSDYTVSFENATSDVTLVCTTGNVMGGMLGHGYEGADYTLSINMDEKSGYTGKMFTTNGATCYQVMAMCSHATYVLNGEEVSRYTNTYPSTKLTIVAPTAGDDGYYVTPVDGVASYVVALNAQITAYDENGNKIANLSGMTGNLGSTTVTEGFDGKIFDLIKSAKIVNGLDNNYSYELNNGALTVYTGKSSNYASGWFTLQVNQYDAEGNLLATGITTVYDIKEVSTADQLISAFEKGGNVVLTADLAVTEGLTLANGKTLVLDLNGKTVSGACNASQGYLFMVNNGAKLTVLDSSEAQTGKITFAQGTSDTGWAIDLEGELVLESGTIELTGDSWSIGYAVDVRPNAWGTAYQYPTVFTMNGGKVVSSDGAIRVASSSSETYTGVSAKFVMNGGEVEAAWDGIFVQQSNAAYDILTVELNGGKVASALSPVRVYGPVATSVVGGAEKPMTLKIGAAAELSVIGEIDTTRTWYKNGVVVLGGGMTVEALEQYSTIVIAE